MTGFGRCEISDDKGKFTVELKSVNHRYLDMNIKLPRKFNLLEGALRAVVKEMVERGKMDIYISYENFQQNDISLKYNPVIAEDYLRHLRKMAQVFELTDDIRLSTLARLPEVFTMEDSDTDAENLWPQLEKTIRGALEQFTDSREKEGCHLKEDLLDKLNGMLVYIDDIESRAPEILKEYYNRLLEKVRETLADRQVEEDRIIQEVTIFADKICVDEETVRLRSHIQSMKEALQSGGSVGRKLDFIAQEMNREANTILSKSNDLKTSEVGINLKTDIEKVREQIQNIE